MLGKQVDFVFSGWSVVRHVSVLADLKMKLSLLYLELGFIEVCCMSIIRCLMFWFAHFWFVG